MQTPVDDVETVILSHWHSDHSGGMLSFLGMRSPSARPCSVDLHPDRPEARGIAPRCRPRLTLLLVVYRTTRRLSRSRTRGGR
ncbi:hypothetical protein EV363DRAFT_1213933 [Boletus edulis]|nr:hypothetical protein EV363DRAFT_1213933 [Boletus edulis]